MNVIDIKTCFLRTFRGLDYTISESLPLITDDPTLLFVNASATPFKSAMMAGESIPNTAQVQRCFRANIDDAWLLFFEMLGVVGMRNHLDHFTKDVVAFLTNESGICSKEHLHTVVHPEDTFLRNAWLQATDGRPVHFLRQNSDKYWTRWSYGKNVTLSGRGLTVVWENIGIKPCNSDCDIHCSCPRFLPLGNIIAVENAVGISYAEIGFGAECLAAIAHGGAIYDIDEYAWRVRAIGTLGYTDKESKRLSNLLIGIARLVEEGCRPGNKRASYVLRRLMRDVGEIVIGRHGLTSLVDGITSVLQATSADEQTTYICTKEIGLYCASIQTGILNARRFIGKHNQTHVEELRAKVRDTFGLPHAVIDELLYHKRD